MALYATDVRKQPGALPDSHGVAIEIKRIGHALERSNVDRSKMTPSKQGWCDAKHERQSVSNR
jgi:hypothetical protein